MPAASRMFNGTTLAFNGSAVTKLVGLSFRAGGAEVDVTQPEDLVKLYEAGQDDLEVNAKFKGGCTLVRKARGTLAIVWKDGTTSDCPGTWQVMDIETTGDWDAPITGSAKLRPTVPDAA
jgi:hypothetical protein